MDMVIIIMSSFYAALSCMVFIALCNVTDFINRTLPRLEDHRQYGHHSLLLLQACSKVGMMLGYWTYIANGINELLSGVMDDVLDCIDIVKLCIFFTETHFLIRVYNGLLI